MSNTDHWIRDEHYRAELLRLRAGYDGCGCSLCQQFYPGLDLNKYGGRVERFGDSINIEAGKTGADLWNEYHDVDHWINSDQVFLHYGKGYGVTETGETVCLGDEKDVINTSMPDISKLKVVAVKSRGIHRRGR